MEGEVAVRRVQTLETEFFTEYGRYSSDLLSIGFPDRPARKFYGLEIALGAGEGACLRGEGHSECRPAHGARQLVPDEV